MPQGYRRTGRLRNTWKKDQEKKCRLWASVSAGGRWKGSARQSWMETRISLCQITCLTIVSVFTLCWMPLQVALILPYGENLPRPVNLLRWLSIFTCFNSCVNPFVYGLMWRPFRAAVREVRIMLAR